MVRFCRFEDAPHNNVCNTVNWKMVTAVSMESTGKPYLTMPSRPALLSRTAKGWARFSTTQSFAMVTMIKFWLGLFRFFLDVYLGPLSEMRVLSTLME